MDNQKRYIAEFIGTFALVFCGTGAIIINDLHDNVVSHLGIAITFGLIVMAMIYAFGSISGAHINPAVSIGFACLSKLKPKDTIVYSIVQIIGGLLASFLLLLLFPEHETLGATFPSGSVQQSFVLELILSYFLMLVIVFVSQNPSTSQYTAIAVGATVLLEALFAGPVCGASMNPARSIAPAIASGHIQHLWIYIVAPIIGSLLAGLTWRGMKG